MVESNNRSVCSGEFRSERGIPSEGGCLESEVRWVQRWLEQWETIRGVIWGAFCPVPSPYPLPYNKLISGRRPSKGTVPLGVVRSPVSWCSSLRAHFSPHYITLHLGSCCRVLSWSRDLRLPMIQTSTLKLNVQRKALTLSERKKEKPSISYPNRWKI